MASPFEVDSTPLSDSVRRRAEEFRFRNQTRKVIEEKRVTTHWMPKRDILWQHNPDRVLKYRPAHLHYYGWIPLAIIRNWKATVFSEVYLHVQNLLLLSWMAAIHITGVGVQDADLATLVIMFGNPYLGGIFNYGMVIVFILGLFITLVINRWWSIRVAYAKLMGTTTDLCMVVAGSIQNSKNSNDRRIRQARTEITRLLNLGHLLVIAKADAQNEEFLKSYGVRRAFRSMKTGLQNTFQSEKLTRKSSGQSASPVYAHALFKPRNLLTFDTMVSEGLMNRDEWDLLNEAETEGMPAYQMVYFWVHALLNKCREAEWIISAPQMLPLMLNKLNAISESGSSIINTINSQMPYPYVHLVSFVVHVYLIILSTWFGCFLHTGRIGEKFELNAGVAVKADDDIKTSVWMVFWCYLLMCIANFSYQGLLDMHTLLDNPFGNHCTKFPLRASVSRVTNATRAMLTYADKFPAAFDDVFQTAIDGDDESVRESVRLHSGGNRGFADFLNPRSTGQLPGESISSWQTNEHDKPSRPMAYTKEKRQTDNAPIDATQQRRNHSPHETSSQTTHPTTMARMEQGDMPSKIGKPAPDQRNNTQPSGDAVIQERFLQGALHHSIDVLTDKGEGSSSHAHPSKHN